MGTTRSYACTTQTALTRLGSNVRHTSRVLLGMGARRATLVSLLLWRRVLQRLPRLQGGPQKPVSIAGAQLCPWNARRKLYQQVGNFVGSVASPLWSNIFLTPFDRQMTLAGFCLTRWADDFVVLCRTRAEAQRALATAERFLQEELGVRLHPQKTRIVH